MTETNENRLRFAAALFSLVLVVFAIARVSSAAFTDTTDSTNEFVAGDVTISDDDAGSAMFNLGNMAPGDAAVTKCINVTYTGTLDAAIELYGAVGAGIGNGNSGLEDYLDLTVTKGDSAVGGESADCTNFANGVQAYSGTLGGFVTTHADFASGNGSWAATGGSNETASYKFEISLQDNDLAEGQSASAKFTWEAQSN